ncbi:Hexose carrier protein HEX6 [Linum perenne]
MLIIGKVLLGISIGFNNQSVPFYLSEMAPASPRGAIHNGFQLSVGIGVLAANLIKFGKEKFTAGNERRKLFFIDGVQMFVSQILVVGIMVTELGDHNGIGKQYAMVVIVRIINYVARFGLSWGPLGWLVPSEIFSMEIRSTGAEYCGGGSSASAS